MNELAFQFGGCNLQAMIKVLLVHLVFRFVWVEYTFLLKAHLHFGMLWVKWRDERKRKREMHFPFWRKKEKERKSWPFCFQLQWSVLGFWCLCCDSHWTRFAVRSTTKILSNEVTAPSRDREETANPLYDLLVLNVNFLGKKKKEKEKSIHYFISLSYSL